MKKYKISSRYLDKCIRTIEDNCYNTPLQAFTGNPLAEFYSKPKNVQALRLLEAAHEITTTTPDGAMHPAIVWLDDKGVLHFYTKREKRLSVIKGFIAGVVSTVISTVLFPYLFNLLTNPPTP